MNKRDFLKIFIFIDCKQKFPKGSIKLRTHLKKFHNNDSSISSKLYKFECQKCYSRFKSAEILKSHIQTKHEDNKIKCPYCPYMLPLKRKSDLYRHHYRHSDPKLSFSFWKSAKINRTNTFLMKSIHTRPIHLNRGIFFCDFWLKL